MALDDLLAKLEHDGGTRGTPDVPADVPANPLQTLAGTRGTCGTSQKDKGGGDSSETLPTDTATRAVRWLFRFADREPLESWFAPPCTHAEALAAEPDAVAAEPLPEVRTPPVRTPVRTETAATGCKSCRHRKRPGLSSPGYCGGERDDLPPAYGLHHPLRKLPDDQGKGCASYRPHED
ncbi:hypothetical protein [Thauera chlorobenzoica]|uniref:Uncharacterized protein n=1 Tax=Thauera chlorobenzoica TaxID=96773 RepID=A0A1L6FHX0_9RHOO|nr:hypothetical protein [Thauera chlorobenzoica]APR06260.1 hypothetical protein Tchl_3460 [Thauera chlorobenzoica]